MKVAIIESDDHTELSENMIRAAMGDTVTVVRTDEEPDVVVKVDSEPKEVYNYEMVPKEYHPAPCVSKKYQPKGHERKYKYHK